MWDYRGRIAELVTPWIRLVGERWKDDRGRDLEYWRTENAHSVIVIPVCGEDLLFPPKSFRPGVGTATLDFPGGRLEENVAPADAAIAILKREMGASREDIVLVEPISRSPFMVNSSTSNQLLYGFRAELRPEANAYVTVGYRYSINSGGMRGLLEELTCLQCRSLLLEMLCQFQEEDE